MQNNTYRLRLSGCKDNALFGIILNNLLSSVFLPFVYQCISPDDPGG